MQSVLCQATTNLRCRRAQVSPVGTCHEVDRANRTAVLAVAVAGRHEHRVGAQLVIGWFIMRVLGELSEREEHVAEDKRENGSEPRRDTQGEPVGWSLRRIVHSGAPV